jgi:hypothetical protein
MTMDATQMQQVLRNYGHSDARAAIEGKQSYEWERALRDAGFDDAAVVVTKFVPPQPKLGHSRQRIVDVSLCDGAASTSFTG